MKLWEHFASLQSVHLSHGTVEMWEGAAFHGLYSSPSVLWKEAPAVACELMSEQAEEEPASIRLFLSAFQ